MPYSTASGDRGEGESTRGSAQAQEMQAVAAAGPSSQRMLLRDFIQQSLYHPVRRALAAMLHARAACMQPPMHACEPAVHSPGISNRPKQQLADRMCPATRSLSYLLL